MLKSSSFMCLLAFTVCADQIKELPELIFKNRIAYEKGSDVSFTGKGRFITMMGEKCVETIGTYKQGIRQGLFTDKFCKGSLLLRGFYDDKKMVGHHEEWDIHTKEKVADLLYDDNGNLMDGWRFQRRNGDVQTDVIYENGKMRGYYLPYSSLYNPHKCKGLEYEYYEDDHFVDCREYKAIHKAKKEVEDTFSGIKKEYWDNGHIKFEREYSNGKRVGTTKSYYKTGELREEAPHKAGVREGIIIGYFPSRKIMYKEHFHDGKREGIRKDYYENGSLRAESSYTKGKMDYSKIYFPDGKLQEEKKFSYGKQNGLQKRYYENGQIKWEHFFEDGISMWYKKYDEDGHLINEH